MIYAVLGMHKSGTTLVSDILHHAGVSMVERERQGGYEAGNKWERVETSELNKRLLGRPGIHSLDLEAPPRERLSADPELEEARGMAEAEGVGDWGFKDPRSCLTWPLWSASLPDVRIVGVYRHYHPVVARYLRYPPPHHLHGFDWPRRVGKLALKRWCEYNEAVLEAVRSAPERSILVSYEDLVSDGYGTENLLKFLGRSTAAVRQPRAAKGKGTAHWLANGAARFVGADVRPRAAALYRQLENARVSVPDAGAAER
jgi:hypothetical protein